MNQTFSFPRWWMLVTLHWVGNRKRYMLAIPAIAGLFIAWFSFMMAIQQNFNPLNVFLQYATYFWGLYVIGCLYASTVFSDLGNQPQGIGFLAVPASHLEKLLCALLFVILFFTVFTLAFYLVDFPMVHLANRMIAEGHYHMDAYSQNIGPAKVYNVFTGAGGPGSEIDYHMFMLSYFAVQSAFVLGSVWFTRYSFIKTTVAILLIIFVYMLFVDKILGNMLPEGWHAGGFLEWWRDPAPGQFHIIRLSAWMADTITFLFKYSLPFIFWGIAYFRLKEKEL